MTPHPQTREMWDVKGSGAEHKSEERDAETQNTSDEGQTTTGTASVVTRRRLWMKWCLFSLVF